MGIDKDWCTRMAAREGDADIGAGTPLHPLRQAEPDWPPASTAVGEHLSMNTSSKLPS
jgi:hypothetical protein